jgi:hypothetical protein
MRCFKEIHQEIYEEMIEETGVEPHWRDLEARFRDRIANMVDNWKDSVQNSSD